MHKKSEAGGGVQLGIFCRYCTNRLLLPTPILWSWDSLLVEGWTCDRKNQQTKGNNSAWQTRGATTKIWIVYGNSTWHASKYEIHKLHQRYNRKVLSSNSGRSWGRIFFSRVNFLIRCLFHPVLLQWHIKDPCHSATSTDGRLHLKMHLPLTQWSQSGLSMLWNLLWN